MSFWLNHWLDNHALQANLMGPFFKIVIPYTNLPIPLSEYDEQQVAELCERVLAEEHSKHQHSLE